MGRKGEGRIPDCHPAEPHQGGGLCKRCYNREWFRKYRSGRRCAEPGCGRAIHARNVCAAHYMTLYQATTPKGPGKQHGSVYPQAIVRVPVKGWGCL